MCKQITLTDQQKKNGAMIIDALNKLGFKNKVVQDAIVMICYKESGFLAKVEWCYSRRDAPGGDVSKLRRLFSTRLARFSDAQILKLLDDCKEFFDTVYGKPAQPYMAFQTGNTEKYDGWKYRGRAYNGITFKVQYAEYSKKLGVDLVKNPELLEQPKYSAEAVAHYMIDNFKRYNKQIVATYGASASDLTDIDKALMLVYSLNAGQIKINLSADSTGGWQTVQCAKKWKVAEQVREVAGGGSGGKLPILPLLAGGLLFFLIYNPKWIKKNTPKGLKKFFR
jgi:hypothetical protein